MKMIKIVNGFPQLPDGQLLVRSDVINNSMAGNPNFPTPSPTLAEFTTTINSLRAAVERAEVGSRQDVAKKMPSNKPLFCNFTCLAIMFCLPPLTTK